MLRFAFMDRPFKFRPHIFDRVWRLRWLLQNIAFCFHRIISVLIWSMCGVLSCWKVHLWPSLCFLSVFWLKPSFWLKWPGTWWTSYALDPGPLPAKRPQSINDSPPYFTVVMRCFSLYASLWCKHADGVQFWSHLTIAQSSSHSSNDVWQTPDAWICWLLLVRAFFMQPFQRACWYGGGILWWFWNFVTPRRN